MIASYPTFGIVRIPTASGQVPVREAVIADLPFCRLIRFERLGYQHHDPPLLIVAPLSGHMPVLMRDVVAGLLPDHDIYLTDWRDAQLVPPQAGAFGLDDNIAYIMEFLRRIGPDCHLLGVSQAPVPILAALSLLAADGADSQPRSASLISGFVDPRINPTRLRALAANLPSSWFEDIVAITVPSGWPGAGRRVYPAAAQRTAMLSYLNRHMSRHLELYHKVMFDDGSDPRGHPFLRLYLSLMNLPSEFMSDTVDRIFRRADLPAGRMTWRGIPVRPEAVTRTALLTIEGGRDDVSGPGQTHVAQTLCRNIPAARRAGHTERAAGHFGVFYGRLWRESVVPVIRDFIRNM